MAARTPRGYGQYDGTARALERIGDRWALLIVRDLLSGARRYGDLKTGLPRIPTNILSDRLKELQVAGVVRRVPTVRGGYELTALGRGLAPVVDALERWGWPLLGDVAEGEVITPDSVSACLRAAFRPDAAGVAPATHVLRVGEVTVAAVVDDHGLHLAPSGPGALPPPRRHAQHQPESAAAGAPAATGTPATTIEIMLTPEGFRDLLAGHMDAPTLTDADPIALRRFARTFGMPAVEASERA